MEKNLVWFGEIERKFCQIIKGYLYLPFFLLFILCIKGLYSTKSTRVSVPSCVLAPPPPSPASECIPPPPPEPMERGATLTCGQGVGELIRTTGEKALGTMNTLCRIRTSPTVLRMKMSSFFQQKMLQKTTLTC